MTNPEIVKWLAEKVMEWRFSSGRKLEDGEFSISSVGILRLDVNGCCQIWNPLTDARATDQVMEALEQRGFVWLIEPSMVTIYSPGNLPFPECAVNDRGWKRALCTAAVRATGGSV